MRKKPKLPHNVKVGKRLLETRLAANIKQPEAAKTIGRDVGQISRYENGEFAASAETLSKLAKLYGTTIEYLLTGAKNG